MKLNDKTPKRLHCGIGSCPGVYELVDVTPDDLDCSIGACPGVYEMKNVTPDDVACSVGYCPTVYNDGDDLVIIGKRIPEELMQQLEGKVGDDEYVIRISKAFFANVFPREGTAG